MNFNAKDAKAIRRGTQRPCSATFAQNFATFAVKFNDSLRLKLDLTRLYGSGFCNGLLGNAKDSN